MNTKKKVYQMMANNQQEEVNMPKFLSVVFNGLPQSLQDQAYEKMPVFFDNCNIADSVSSSTSEDTSTYTVENTSFASLKRNERRSNLDTEDAYLGSSYSPAPLQSDHEEEHSAIDDRGGSAGAGAGGARGKRVDERQFPDDDDGDGEVEEKEEDEFVKGSGRKKKDGRDKNDEDSDEEEEEEEEEEEDAAEEGKPDWMRKQFTVNRKKVPLSRITMGWLKDPEKGTDSVVRKYLSLTASRIIHQAHYDLTLKKCIYVAFPSMWLDIVNGDMRHHSDEELSEMRFAVKCGYATGTTETLLVANVKARYSTCMDVPTIYIMMVDGVRTFEIRQIETNLQGR